MNVNDKLAMANLIATSQSKKFYETLKNQLMLVDIFRSEYEGEIKARGDKVKVNAMNLQAAETLHNDKQKFNSTPIGLTQYELAVNRQTVHAVEITNLADLQSDAYMEKLQKEMAYQIFLKMEKDVLAFYLSKVPAGNKLTVTTPTKYGKADIVKQRKAFGKKLIDPNNRYNILDVNYYSEAIADGTLSSSDFVQGQSLTSQKLPNVLGFKHAEHNILADNSGISFDPSGLHTVVQKGINIEVVSKKAANELAFMVVADIVWDVKEFDVNRLFSIGE